MAFRKEVGLRPRDEPARDMLNVTDVKVKHGKLSRRKEYASAIRKPKLSNYTQWTPPT